MRRVLFAGAFLALTGCSTHAVLAGADEPPLAPPASVRDAGIVDASAMNARDARQESPAAQLDAAPGSTPRDASMPQQPLHCMGTSADCDTDASNGCEADLADDPKHCGSCGVACQSPDCACRGGTITVVCPAGRADCDGDSRNGCEVDIDTSMQNCGRCGRLCHTMGHDALDAVCVGGHCQITCQIEPFGQGDCDDDPDNGCETNLWTNDNCGTCGVRCTCIDGVCRN
jgi:hypothetical protein